MTADAVVGAVPSPPPKPLPESETVSPIPLGRHLWDLLALHGPLSRHDLFYKTAIPIGEPWREYMRWNDIPRGTKPSQTELAAADRFYVDHAIEQSVRRGWLIERRDGTFAAGECPPEHRALSTVGGVHDDGEPNVAALVRRIIGDNDRKALDLLRHKANPARRKRLKRRVDALRKSLQHVGQINEIVIWHPIGQSDPIFVDGQTRYELLTELGIEPRVRKLPSDMSATHVLGMRVEAELANSTKDEAKEARDRYIADLAELGYTQQHIADTLGLSRQHVGRIVRMAEKSGRRETRDEDLAEMVELREAGWTIRDIAEETGWPKSTVDRLLRTSVPDAHSMSNGTRPTKRERVKAAAAAIGAAPETTYTMSANVPSVKAAAKVDPTFIPRFTDDDNLRMTLDHAYDHPELRRILDAWVAEHYRS